MDLRRLDEIASAAMVSSIEAEVAGWWCKADPDLPFRRANVAVPPVDAAHDRMVFVDGLDQVRRWYHELGLRLIVQVSSALPEHDLVDSWLEAAGLDVEAPVHLMTTDGPADATPMAPGRGPRAAAGIDEHWARADGTLSGGSPVEAARARGLRSHARRTRRSGARRIGSDRRQGRRRRVRGAR